MKTKNLILIALLTFSFKPMALRAQGSLTPPGPPGPTMMTLSQVEPRTPITNTASLVTISQPGSYYLTANITVTSGNAININTNGVTLDLNGFTISSTAASANGYGILLNGGLRNITLVTGVIQSGVTNNGSGVYGGGGFTYGINFSGNPPVNVRVSGISISGCQFHGIFLENGDSTIVESCTVRTMGGTGIYASTIKNCSAIDCGNTAIIGDQVSDCRGQSTGGSDGIIANYTAQNCYGTSSSGYGLYAGETALNCYGTSSSNYGLFANETALNCYGYCGGSGTGLDTATAQNCVGSGSVYGVVADTAENCAGFSGTGTGLDAYVVLNCYGYCGGSGYGIYASLSATGCYGYSSSGTGLFAFIANVCHGENGSGTSISTSHNVNSY
jgi:hypothetical protein